MESSGTIMGTQFCLLNLGPENQPGKWQMSNQVIKCHKDQGKDNPMLHETRSGPNRVAAHTWGNGRGRFFGCQRF